MPDKIIHPIQVDGYCARFGGKWGRLQLGTFGSYGIEQLRITLGDSWTDLVVYANFVTADGTTPVLVPESGLVDVPPEATAKPGMGNIVLDGTADGVRIYSVNIPYIMLNHSDLSGEAPAPTPDKWEQYIAQVQSIVDKAVPPDGTVGYVLTKGVDGNAWAPQTGGGGGGGGTGYNIGHGLKVVDGTTLEVDTAEKVEQDNTLPVTSAAVYVEVGNIDALLQTI